MSVPKDKISLLGTLLQTAKFMNSIANSSTNSGHSIPTANFHHKLRYRFAVRRRLQPDNSITHVNSPGPNLIEQDTDIFKKRQIAKKKQKLTTLSKCVNFSCMTIPPNVTKDGKELDRFALLILERSNALKISFQPLFLASI